MPRVDIDIVLEVVVALALRLMEVWVADGASSLFRLLDWSSTDVGDGGVVLRSCLGSFSAFWTEYRVRCSMQRQ